MPNGKFKAKHLRALTLQESIHAAALAVPALTTYRAFRSSSRQQWHFLALEPSAATSVYICPSRTGSSLWATVRKTKRYTVSVSALNFYLQLVLPWLSMFMASQQHTEGYNDVPGTEPKPVWPEAFIECKESLALPCLWRERRYQLWDTTWVQSQILQRDEGPGRTSALGTPGVFFQQVHALWMNSLWQAL